MPISVQSAALPLKVLTWNILNDFEPERLRQVYTRIRDEAPDIALLQEFITAYSHEGITVGIEEAIQTLEAFTGMVAVYAVSEVKSLKKPLNFGNITLYNPRRVRWTSAAHQPNDQEVLNPSTPGVALAVFEDLVTGRPILVANAHLTHGGQHTFARYMQVVQVNNYADQFVHLLKESVNLEPVVLFGGDLNMLPEADPIRYLKGLTIPSFLVKLEQADEISNVYGTYWVDAWDYLHPDDPGYTSKNQGTCAVRTARGVGVDAHKMPARRIDYLFVHGWVYGKPGTPLEMTLLDSNGETDLSDHHGLVLHLQL